MFLGLVARWDARRRYGFILSDARIDGIAEDREIYCHRSGLPKGVTALVQGQRCEFQIIPAHVPGKQAQAKIIRIVPDEMAEAA